MKNKILVSYITAYHANHMITSHEVIQTAMLGLIGIECGYMSTMVKMVRIFLVTSIPKSNYIWNFKLTSWWVIIKQHLPCISIIFNFISSKPLVNYNPKWDLQVMQASNYHYKFVNHFELSEIDLIHDHLLPMCTKIPLNPKKICRSTVNLITIIIMFFLYI